jgi:hypothetical protein
LISKAKLKQKQLDRKFIKVYREQDLKIHDGKCTFCYEPLTYKNVTADHAKARSTGGSNQSSNIVAACRPCNQAKGSMTVSQFKKLIKHPFGETSDIRIIMAWSRRKINLQVDRSIKHIKTYFGME